QQGGMLKLKENTVYAALRRREAVEGDIVRIEDEWGLKDWFQNMPALKTAKAAKKGKKGKKGSKSKGKAQPRPAKAAATAPAGQATPAAEPQRPSATEPKPPAAGAVLTTLDAAEDALKKADKPIHINELAAKLGGYGKSTN